MVTRDVAFGRTQQRPMSTDTDPVADLVEARLQPAILLCSALIFAAFLLLRIVLG